MNKSIIDYSASNSVVEAPYIEDYWNEVCVYFHVVGMEKSIKYLEEF